MLISDKGIEFIAQHEALRLCPYIDVVGVPTIGYGNTYYEDGTRVKITDSCISEKRANKLFKIVLEGFVRFVGESVTQPLKQAQFDALVSFCYNVGKAAFKNSTLLKRVNASPDDKNIAYQFSRWNKGGGKVIRGLVNRRQAESDLYFS